MIELDYKKKEKEMVKNYSLVKEQVMTAFEKIENGKSDAVILNSLFRKLSDVDYRSDSQIELDNIEITQKKYIKAFREGAKLSIDIPREEWTALNAERTRIVTDVDEWCLRLSKENFRRVQVHFLDEYKRIYKNMMEYEKKIAISPDVIIATVNSLSSKGGKK